MVGPQAQHKGALTYVRTRLGVERDRRVQVTRLDLQAERRRVVARLEADAVLAQEVARGPMQRRERGLSTSWLGLGLGLGLG